MSLQGEIYAVPYICKIALLDLSFLCTACVITNLRLVVMFFLDVQYFFFEMLTKSLHCLRMENIKDAWEMTSTCLSSA